MKALRDVAKDTARTLIPRRVRNALRRPRVSFQRFRAKLRYQLGITETIPLQRDWTPRCHPLCKPAFEAFLREPEQAGELNDFLRRCIPGMKFLDVGAHWGVFTLAALHQGGQEARALAIEASRDAARICSINFALNHVSDSVELLVAAAGAFDGELEMLTTGAGGDDYFVVPETSRPDTVRVRQIAVSALCQSRRFVPTHMKVDVEGFEEEVLTGAVECLRNHRPMLFLELHGDMIRRRARKPQTVLEILMEIGYRRFEHQDRVLKREEIESRGYNVRMVCHHRD